jgi:hypothetical protein
MRRALVVLAAALAAAPTALGAPPAVVATASPGTGVGFVTVTLTATGDAASYRWDPGDGSAPLDGPVVRHAYAAGTWTAVVTATSPAGESAQASVLVHVAPHAVAVTAPRSAEYASRVVFRGRLAAGWRGMPVQIYRGRTFVGRAETRAGGTFRVPVLLRRPGTYHARFGRVRSAEIAVRVVPRLTLSLPETVALGERVRVRVRVEPAHAGRVELRAGGRLLRERLLQAPSRAGVQRVRVRLVPRAGFTTVERRADIRAVVPELGPGSRGPAVRELERRLAERRFVLRRVDDRYELDTVEAVYAFQRLHGLAPTGRTDAAFWRLLERSSAPRARYPGNHIEVDKARQVLLVVRGGLVVRVVHVSTGATGNTPLGSWRVYRKVPGFDWVLYYPMYFLRGFAIHGYPSVPPYPASHGCVRVPMWLAATLYAEHVHGTTVVVY